MFAIQISYYFSYKSAKFVYTWRQIFKLENYDFCLITRLSNSNIIPAINAFMIYMKRQFSNLPTKCPIEPRIYDSGNVTINDAKNESFAAIEINEHLTPGGYLPNGVYRNVLRLHTKKDPVGFMLYWQTEIYNKMGEQDF